MTEDQKTLARGLCRAAIPIMSKTSSFAQDMAWRAEQRSPKALSAKQAEWLRTAVISYRSTVPAAVVALAEHLGTEEYAAQCMAPIWTDEPVEQGQPMNSLNELSGPALDQAVAGLETRPYRIDGREGPEYFSPSTNWEHGGPIIERENLSVLFDGAGRWGSPVQTGHGTTYATGPTPLVAAMRAFVALRAR